MAARPDGGLGSTATPGHQAAWAPARWGARPLGHYGAGVLLVQVTRINPRLAALDVLCVGDTPLDTTFAGTIRCGGGMPAGCVRGA